MIRLTSKNSDANLSSKWLLLQFFYAANYRSGNSAYNKRSPVLFSGILIQSMISFLCLDQSKILHKSETLSNMLGVCVFVVRCLQQDHESGTATLFAAAVYSVYFLRLPYISSGRVLQPIPEDLLWWQGTHLTWNASHYFEIFNDEIMK